MKKIDSNNNAQYLAFDPTSHLFNTIVKENEDSKNQFDLIIDSYFKKIQINMKNN